MQRGLQCRKILPVQPLQVISKNVFSPAFSSISCGLKLKISMSLFSGAAQGAKPIAPVVLLERWVLTKPWQPYWALVDPATSELKILPCMAFIVSYICTCSQFLFGSAKASFRSAKASMASQHCFSWESASASKMGKDFILTKPQISSKGLSKDRRRRQAPPQPEKPEQVGNCQLENLSID